VRKIVLVFLLLLAFISASLGCTEFLLSPEKNNGLVISGRSMEFSYPLNSKVVFFNRGESFSSHMPDGSEAASWENKYGFVGLNAFDIPTAISDGLNEMGLSLSALWLPGTEYEQVSPESDPTKVIELFDLPSWILGNFDTLESVREALESMTIWGEENELLGEVPPLHLSLHDKFGGSMVVEFIDGEMKIYDNPNAVLTNAPELSWHLENLRNYVNLSPYMKEGEINGITYKGMGFGSGYVGIPGDGTPPSRFVRIALLREFSNPVETEEEGVMLALHLLNTVDIPAGVSKREGDGPASFENTQWVTIKDNKNLKLYFRSYDCSSLFLVDLNNVDFSNGSEHESIIVDKEFSVIDAF